MQIAKSNVGGWWKQNHQIVALLLLLLLLITIQTSACKNVARSAQNI